MRKALFVTLLAALCVLAYQQAFVPAAVAAGGASIAQLDSAWGNPTPLATPLGKVIYNVPNHRGKINLTYILQAANPNTDYTVGFDIEGLCLATAPEDPPSSFGGVTRKYCNTYGPSPYCGQDTVGVYLVGTMHTDEYGDGDFHINLPDIPSASYNTVFWVSQGAGTASPVASTACFGDKGSYETIVVP